MQEEAQVDKKQNHGQQIQNADQDGAREICQRQNHRVAQRLEDRVGEEGHDRIDERGDKQQDQRGNEPDDQKIGRHGGAVVRIENQHCVHDDRYGRDQEDQIDRRRLLEVLLEGLEKVAHDRADGILLPVADDVIHGGRGRADGHDRDAADEPQNVQNHKVRYARQEDHDAGIGVKQFHKRSFFGLPSFQQVICPFVQAYKLVLQCF